MHLSLQQIRELQLHAQTKAAPVPLTEEAAGSDFHPSGFRPNSEAKQSDISSSVMCSPGHHGVKRWLFSWVGKG
jgi:hypothetical protein